jgi:hypothetical protein
LLYAFFHAYTKKQTAQGFSHAVSDFIFIPGLVLELNLMTLPLWWGYFFCRLDMGNMDDFGRGRVNHG